MRVRSCLVALPVLTALLYSPLAASQDFATAEQHPLQTGQSVRDERGDGHWRMMEEGWHDGFGYGHWGFSLLFWALVTAVVILAVRALSSTNNGGTTTRSPLEILEERYARWEIDREEYLRRREDLTTSKGS